MVEEIPVDDQGREGKVIDWDRNIEVYKLPRKDVKEAKVTLRNCLQII